MPKSTSLAAAIFVLVTATACSPSAEEPSAGENAANPANPANPAPALPSYDGWLGTWTGEDGQVLNLSPAGDGNYSIDIRSSLDTHSLYIGIPGAEGIGFNRGGQRLVLREATGAEAGFEGKEDCLVITRDEGFCRD